MHNLPFKTWIKSFGISIKLESDEKSFLEAAVKSANKALVGSIEIVPEEATDHSFRLYSSGRASVVLEIDEAESTHRGERSELLPFFESMLRIKVAEFAKDRVFLHAGAVGWKGKAILFPANSFGGKSTLTAEFVKRGASYYSDDYAVLDSNGLVHPFARPISIRVSNVFDKGFKVKEIAPQNLGGELGSEGIPVGTIWITHYDPNAAWDPKLLTPGQAVMEIISQTIPIRYNPEFSLKVLKKIASNAILLKCPRSDAREFVELFLDFVDNKAI